MLDNFMASNELDANGNPSGGSVRGKGLEINWQDGPLGRGEGRIQANGAFVETVIASGKQRLEFYQVANGGKFNCVENARAIKYLDLALDILNHRTKAREARSVEGTHEV
jgi:hypothetical protein